MAGFWIGLLIVSVICIAVLFLCAGVYSWMHDGRASFWEDSGEAVRFVRDEMREPERGLNQTGEGYARTEVRRGRN